MLSVTRWYDADRLLLWLFSAYLLVDALNGFLLNEWGRSFGLSAFYKLSLLLLTAWRLSQLAPHLLCALMLAGTVLMLGPLYSQLRYGLSPVGDISLILKLLSPVLCFAYFAALCRAEPGLFRQGAARMLGLNLATVLLNFALGAVGFGYSSYLPQPHLPQLDLGSKGFFNAANEVSVVLLALAALSLPLCWQRHKAGFLLLAAAWIGCASLLLTKTGLAGVVLLIMVVPLWGCWASLSSKWKGLLVVSVLLCLVLAALKLPDLLQQLGLWQKLQYVYQNQGLAGVLLSSRDQYALAIWQISTDYYSEWHRLFGIGMAGVSSHSWKFWAESDLFDLFIFYGVPGLLWTCWVFCGFWLHSLSCHLNRPSVLSASVLLLNSLLLGIAVVAGHVLSSGMLWPVWALANAWLLVPADEAADAA
ncbi:O-antigen ligase family protein [Rheinheimera sp.]|uniref:O-antigen ligase family protein n=1 Tax=Rheinheimera sp. TaxID=1869214 RepID=UPI00307F8E8D